jgi:hypothetical protein
MKFQRVGRADTVRYGAALAGAALSLAAMGAAHASTVTFDWVTPTGLETPGSAPISGTLVLTGSLPSITASNFTGTLTGSLQSFSLTENGLTLATGPSASTWSVTNGVLSPFTDGSITASVSANILTNSYSFTGTATTDSVLSLATLTGNGTLGPILGTYLSGSNELAFFGSGTAAISGSIAPLTETLSATGSGAGYLGYWQIQATPVPLPAAAWFMLSGVLGLMGIGRLSRRPAQLTLG